MKNHINISRFSFSHFSLSLCLVMLFLASLFTLTAVAQTTPQSTPQSAPQTTTANPNDDEQAEALFAGPLRSSGYGAFSTKFTPIQGQFGTMIGGYGGWFINKALLIGGGGYGLTTSINAPQRPGESISFGYGGIVLEYVGASDKVFHYAVQTMIGWGGVGFYRPRDFSFSSRSVSPVMVIEPSLMAELNITNFLRLSVGGGYRFVTGVELAGLTNGDMSGVSAMLNVKFGGF
ncbi:MAG: hypothetical protein MUF71_04945 [Candidatus Kapabacteria bacterium]|nr:hypothetical protein [Candidatus Kapabacteria bacterium]